MVASFRELFLEHFFLQHNFGTYSIVTLSHGSEPIISGIS